MYFGPLHYEKLYTHICKKNWSSTNCFDVKLRAYECGNIEVHKEFKLTSNFCASSKMNSQVNKLTKLIFKTVCSK